MILANLDLLFFEKNGYVLCRGLIPQWLASSWLSIYQSLADEDRQPEHNPVAVNAVNLQPLLSIIARDYRLLNAVGSVLGPDIALYNQRFVVKDAKSRGPVFWHQDCGYHRGNFRKLSAFVALSECSNRNGGYQVCPGTHHYGYLGDTGEIDIDARPAGYTIYEPDMAPGDVMLMDSRLWHSSTAHVAGPDRIVADIIYQPADDPTTGTVLRGMNKFNLPPLYSEKVFKWTRSSRLKDAQGVEP